MLKAHTKYLSAAVLVASNVIPLFGVMFFGWDIFSLIFLYWLESGVIAFYTIWRIVVIDRVRSIRSVPQFVGGYGIFMLTHLALLTYLFGPSELSESGITAALALLSEAFLQVRPAVLGLLASHGISFLVNFLGTKEYEKMNTHRAMTAPYQRILVMHMTVFLSAWLVQAFGSPFVGLLMLIAFKTLTDLGSHLRSHKAVQQMKHAMIRLS